MDSYCKSADLWEARYSAVIYFEVCREKNVAEVGSKTCN